MKTPMAQGHNENHAVKKKMSYFIHFFSRRFWVKDPRHSETVSDEKCYLYRSMRLNTTMLGS